VLPRGYEARVIANPAVIRPNASATFHGRDVFGPAAAHLAAGLPFDEIGPLAPEMLVLPPFRGERAGAATHGFIVHVDRFGNLISTVRSDDLPANAQRVEIGGQRVPLVRTYGEGEGLVALIGSSGYLEVALVNGSAAGALGLGVDAQVTVYGR
jgi:S-adenosylmethionine hydrolase